MADILHRVGIKSRKELRRLTEVVGEATQLFLTRERPPASCAF
jgi:hypothetical protein